MPGTCVTCPTCTLLAESSAFDHLTPGCRCMPVSTYIWNPPLSSFAEHIRVYCTVRGSIGGLTVHSSREPQSRSGVYSRVACARAPSEYPKEAKAGGAYSGWLRAHCLRRCLASIRAGRCSALSQSWLQQVLTQVDWAQPLLGALGDQRDLPPSS